MAVIIHKDAQERMQKIAEKLDAIGMRDCTHDLHTMIMRHALRTNAFDGCVTYPAGHGMEGEPSKVDLLIFAESLSSTDLYWVTMTKDGRRDFNGGFNCHTDWFREVMAGTKTLADLWLMFRDDRDQRKVVWSINT